MSGPASGSAEDWEAFYAGCEQIWSGRANPVLVEVAGELPPGTALDLGAGEGGDAVWLAGRGWRVTAVDVSDTALERLARVAADLPVVPERHDLTATFPAGAFDLVSACYLHSPDDGFPRGAVLRRAAAAVAPGGTLLVVGHGRVPPWSHHDHDGPELPTAAEVVDDLGLPAADWTTVHCESRDRVMTGPDGQEASVSDEVVVLCRRSPAG